MIRQVYDPEATPVEGVFLLEASAGTGKTYALERMVARLIGREADPLRIEEILVVTFTNRAAREMKERIRSLLSRRMNDPDRSHSERRRCMAAVSGFDRAPIYTIHGFCQMVLSSWPFESSAPFHQELIPGGELESGEVRSWVSGLREDDVDRELMRNAYVRSGGLEKLIKSVTDGIVNDNIPPGAEVLPTNAESAAFADYIESSAEPGSSLEIAAGRLFARNWSDEAVRDLAKAVTGKKKTAPSLEKIHAHMNACRGIRGIPALSEAVFGDPAGVGVNSHFLDLFHAGVVIRDGMEHLRKETGDGSLSGEAADLADAAAGLFHEMEPYVEFSAGGDKPVISLTKPYMECAFSDLARSTVEQRLEKLKDKTGKWGYADLIRRVADSVSRTDSPLLPVLRRRFKAALIDEFQDTDPRQWHLFRTVFGDPSTGHILALIGDPKQSIYGFRGTGLQAYNEAASSVDVSRIYRLDTNYRSRAPLVAAANRFFAPLFSEPRFEDVRSGKTDSDEFHWQDSEIPVSFISAESKTQAAHLITAEIRSILEPSSGARWKRTDGSIERVSASDIAILVRTQFEEEDILYRLASAGIPAVQIRSRSVLSQGLVANVTGLLDAFESPRKTALWRSVLLDRFFSLPPDLLVQFEENGYLDEFVEKGETWRKMFLAGKSTGAFEQFFRFSSKIGEWAADAGRVELGDVLKQPWPRRILSEPDGLRYWQDWRHICELIQHRQAEGLQDIPGIRQWLNHQGENPDPEGREDAVRLDTEEAAVRVMTMHTAKGLEFPLVFLLGGFSGKSRRKNDGDYRFEKGGTLVVDRVRRESNRKAHLAHEWEEDKRLWYVAFTRASVKLWIPLPSEGPVTQIESLVEAAFSEGDSTCAGSRESDRLPPHQRVPEKEAGIFRSGLRASIISRTAESPVLFSVSQEPDSYTEPLARTERPDLTATPLPADRVSGRDPVTSSYTSLVKAAAGGHPGDSDGTDDRDVDGMGVTDPAESLPEESTEALPLSADRGALFGTLIHALLENCDFEKVRELDEISWFNDTATEELFQACSRRCYPPDWYRPRSRALKAMVRSALRCDIPGLGRLCDINRIDMRPEVEFHMSVPRSSELISETLRTGLAKGYLKGFIDLLLKSEDRWWVVDWKTNVPPGVQSAESYCQDTLKEIMNHHHYHLQYELYLLSLCRTLSGNLNRPVLWDTEIGGAAYLFVRGTREGDSRGVSVNKPLLSRMVSLASDMGLEGVLE